MQRTRFDTLTAALAQPSSRRTALRRGGVVTAIVAAAGLARPATAAQATPPGATPGTHAGAALTGQFRAKVYQGPDKGLAFQGRLHLSGDAQGQLTGQLTPTTGAAVPVSGQLTGAAINLAFYLPQDQAIFGVGTIGQRPDTGAWVVGGPLVGPKPGDSGDWAFCLRCERDSQGILVCDPIECPPKTD